MGYEDVKEKTEGSSFDKDEQRVQLPRKRWLAESSCRQEVKDMKRKAVRRNIEPCLVVDR